MTFPFEPEEAVPSTRESPTAPRNIIGAPLLMPRLTPPPTFISPLHHPSHRIGMSGLEFDDFHLGLTSFEESYQDRCAAKSDRFDYAD